MHGTLDMDSHTFRHRKFSPDRRPKYFQVSEGAALADALLFVDRSHVRVVEDEDVEVGGQAQSGLA